MRMSTAKNIGKRLLQFGLPVIIIGFFLYEVKKNWGELTAQTFHWDPWLLALAFVGFVCQEISYGLIWKGVLARLGARLGLRASLRIYLASEFVRYIPGNIWHVLTRIIWVGKYGVSRPVAFASMAIELITKLAAGVLIFAVSLLFWRDLDAVSSLTEQRIVLALGVGTILALCIILYPPVLNGLLNVALRVLKREPIKLTLRYRDILLVTLFWCASWCVAGSAFFVMLLSLWANTPLLAWPVCIGIYALAWDIGFVSFITPSGLGFREGAIVGLFALALPLPGGLAAIMALLSRFVSTIAELLCVSVAYFSGGRPALVIGQEQALPSDSLDMADTADTAGTVIEAVDSNTGVAEPSASTPLEEQIVGE
ncbi:MAG TPA: lysylphosphatidylglycerol synthase transmembrane domain-containing protein [Ktedonobacteraceae bacterium]|nr:lysylphosphatidylglycerol synthase transmembrane domain-containing protein [Ktedonobacteraceae bacterium]